MIGGSKSIPKIQNWSQNRQRAAQRAIEVVKTWPRRPGKDIQLYAEKIKAVNALADDDDSAYARGLMDELAAVIRRLNLQFDVACGPQSCGSEYIS